jgi:hypothetical protein
MSGFGIEYPGGKNYANYSIVCSLLYWRSLCLHGGALFHLVQIREVYGGDRATIWTLRNGSGIVATRYIGVASRRLVLATGGSFKITGA